MTGVQTCALPISIGPPGQPDYVNSAVEVETTLEPLALLDRLKAIEAELGRTEGARWGPRVIDLDLALWGDRVVDHPRLVVPHRELTRRRFVLAPLADLVPGAVVPGTEQTVAALLAGLGKAPDELSVIEGVDILG